jgi:hypothetical protein
MSSARRRTTVGNGGEMPQSTGEKKGAPGITQSSGHRALSRETETAKDSGGGSGALSFIKFAVCCYLLMLLMLLVFQKQLVFIGATMKGSSTTNLSVDKLPRHLAGRVRAFALKRDNGESFRVVMSNNMEDADLEGVAVFWGGNGMSYLYLSMCPMPIPMHTSTCLHRGDIRRAHAAVCTAAGLQAAGVCQ